MTQFQMFVQENYRSLLSRKDLDKVDKQAGVDVRWFCFDRSQTEDRLKDVLKSQVYSVATCQRMHQKLAFQESFQLRLDDIPCCFGSGGQPEFAVVVVLNDRLAAEHLLFGNPIPKNPAVLAISTVTPAALRDDTAGALLAHLYELAAPAERFGLKDRNRTFHFRC
jgi:hypothetical protein